MTVKPSTIERFNAKYYIDPITGCWVWTAGRQIKGYGYFWDKGKTFRAHRWGYEQHIGPIPEGLTLDHLCRNPSCVNPDHLEPVSHRENVLRGEGPTALQARQTSCMYGHPFDATNTYMSRGKRECRACRRRVQKKWYLRKLGRNNTISEGM